MSRPGNEEFPHKRTRQLKNGWMTKARAWITKQVEIRLSWNNVDRSSTKWALIRFIEVQLTAILSRDALVGNGPLPDWLCRKRGSIALDTFNDNLFLFRCIAIQQGKRADRTTHKAREIATAFYDIHVLNIPKSNIDKLAEIEKRFKLGIRVYKPAQYIKEVDARNGPVWSLIRQHAQ